LSVPPQLAVQRCLEPVELPSSSRLPLLWRSRPSCSTFMVTQTAWENSAKRQSPLTLRLLLRRLPALRRLDAKSLSLVPLGSFPLRAPPQQQTAQLPTIRILLLYQMAVLARRHQALSRATPTSCTLPRQPSLGRSITSLNSPQLLRRTQTIRVKISSKLTKLALF